MNSLGASLFDRYSRTGDPADREQAVRHLEGVLAASPPDHPNRAGYLTNLGSALAVLHHHDGGVAHLDRAVASWRTAAALPAATTQRMRSAVAWGSLARTPEEAAYGHAAAVRLLPRLAIGP